MKSMKCKTGFNKKAEVLVVADVDMKSEDDGLFVLCFFTILNPPLRLSSSQRELNENACILGQAPKS